MMMMALLYFAEICENLSIFFVCTCIVFLIVLGILYINHIQGKDCTFQYKFIKKFSWVFYVSLLLSVIVPDKPTVYAMISASYINQDTPNELAQLVNQRLGNSLICKK